MERLSQKDRVALSRILHNNWDNVFKLLCGSISNQLGVPYSVEYEKELTYIEKNFPDLIDMYLKSNEFFGRNSMRDYVLREIIGRTLGNIDCRKFQYNRCVTQLYNMIFYIIKPYYMLLYSEKNVNEPIEPVKVIESNLSIDKDKFIIDFQSRVVEAKSWEEYVRSFEEYDGLAVEFLHVSNMIGNSIPKNAKIINLNYDDRHLSCEIHKDDFITYKLSYRCKLM